MSSLNDIIKEIEKKNTADVYLFSSEVDSDSADMLITLIRKHENKRRACVLILTTYGGEPDAGYRIVRTIRRYYKKFVLYVYGTCKSTGTLMAIGADEIVMGDMGEFGPLDTQLTKEDELSHTSGLSYLQSLSTLNDLSLKFFDANFISIKQRSSFTITTKTAAEIATKIAIGLISPISEQIDPIKLGEVQRAINIADQYGTRLCKSTTGSDKANKAVTHLMSDYPSHSFVIDFDEAKEIFENVKEMDKNDLLLEDEIYHIVRREGKKPFVMNLTKGIVEDEAAEADKKSAAAKAKAETDAALSTADIEPSPGSQESNLILEIQDENVDLHAHGNGAK
jgi:hypothetical protein